MNKKTLWLTQTAMLIALLIVLQAVMSNIGGALGPLGSQILTGSFVNAVLALSVLVAGLWSGVVVAALSPFFAYLLGIGPQLIAIVPAIALGNVVYVVVLHLLTKGRQLKDRNTVVAWVVSAVFKFVTLYLVVVQLLCNVLTLKAPQIATFTTMFSWPQLITALVGGAVALLVAPVIRKAVKTE